MSMIKRGTCHGKVSISESVYECPSCGHRDVKGRRTKGQKKCSKCNTIMVLLGCSEEDNHPDEDAQ